ncbi:MAG TPA: ParA family protein [Polyangiaceae bacterium]|jgi:chromosome partitioning protein|nr:ParA family protein [Polyangiaceae bacterium]
MSGPARCSVCSTEFEICFRYQVEERAADQGGPRHFCSQRCLEASHTQQADGKARCDACASAFTVEYAAQVVFTGGRRHYACKPECRARVLEGVRAVRLGQMLDPRYLPDDSLVTPDPTRAVETTPTPPPISGIMERPRHPLPAPRKIPRAVAVFNQKGGTAKTTTAVHLAAGLARAGKRVLLVDTDGQGNAGASLGITTERSLYHVLVMGLPFKDAVVPARPGLDLLPANETLAAAELYLSGQRNRDRVLAARLAGVTDLYDFVVLDCSPSLSLMNQNALVVADAVLCPVACDYLSLLGVKQVVRTIKQVNRLLGHKLDLFGVLPTLYDARARLCKESLDTLRETFGDACLDPVHFAIKAKEAPSQGKTLFEYAPGSPTTQDYTRLVERLLGQQLSAAAGGTA